MAAKIICLFSVENNYDQPEFNLVCCWPEKPSIEAVAAALGETFPGRDDADTLAVVNIWSGTSARVLNTDYRLEEVEAGVPTREAHLAKKKGK